jgi:hypothetical protein
MTCRSADKLETTGNSVIQHAGQVHILSCRLWNVAGRQQLPAAALEATPQTVAESEARQLARRTTRGAAGRVSSRKHILKLPAAAQRCQESFEVAGKLTKGPG